jgi:hypothetical protein
MAEARNYKAQWFRDDDDECWRHVPEVWKDPALIFSEQDYDAKVPFILVDSLFVAIGEHERAHVTDRVDGPDAGDPLRQEAVNQFGGPDPRVIDAAHDAICEIVVPLLRTILIGRIVERSRDDGE